MADSSALAFRGENENLAYRGLRTEFRSGRFLLIPAIVGFFLSACYDQIPTDLPSPPLEPRWTRSEPEIARSGCSFVLTGSDGSTRKLHVSRNELPFALPQVDSIQIRTPGVGRGVLVVANTDYTVINGAGNRRSVVIACLVPLSFSNETLRQRVAAARSSQYWAQLEEVLQASPRIQTTSETPIRTAASLLWTSFTNSTWRLDMSPSGGSLNKFTTDQLRPRFELADSASCGPQVGWACATPILKPVVTNARIGWSSHYWIFDFSELEWAGRHGYSISATSSEIYNGSGTCADANDFYFAMSDAISRREADADAMEQAYNDSWNTYTPTCVVRNDSLSTARFRYCIDIWISGKRSFIFGGDNRGPDSTAGYKASRFQEYLDVQTCTAYYVQNVSSIQIPFFHDTTSSPSQHDPKDLTLTCDPNTGIIDVHIEVYDAYCTFPAARWICPAANADIRLIPLSGGSYEVKWIKDGYPSVAVFEGNPENTLFRTLRRDSGNTEPLGWLELITYRNELNRLREALHLPPGCDWQ